LKKLYLVLSLFYIHPTFASFEEWKISYANKASKLGIPKSFVLEQLKDVKENLDVVKFDQNQITSSTTADYKSFIERWSRNNPSRVERAIKVLKENYELLDKVEKKFKVDKEVIVAIWGTETLFGDITGNYDIVESLASLAYEGRRRKFFEIQLNATLRLIYKGHVTRDLLKGSWAGATGQCQFMPSNINGFAVDFDGDGKKDIWTNKGDIFASIASLLKKNGWEYKKSIGSLAYIDKVPEIDYEKYRTVDDYNQLGFRDIDNNLLKSKLWRARRAKTIPLANSPIVLRGSNYEAIVKWNNSSLFAAFNILLVEGIKKGQ